MDGIFLIYKERGWTSFDVCAVLRKKFNTKKVGHTGTLDPFAEGLMICVLGKATKIISFLENYDKEYIATLKFGYATDTLDLTGNVIEEKKVTYHNDDEIIATLKSFKGEIMQVPPMYSALKKDGIPLYMLAREGIEVERKARKIEIKEIELLSNNNNEIIFRSLVSKGTYIRTLGFDIAKKLDNVGTLTSLVRTKIDRFSIDYAKKVNDITEDDLISISEMLPNLTHFIADEKMEMDIKNGKTLKLDGGNLVFIKNKNNDPLAIYELREDGLYHSKRGLF